MLLERKWCTLFKYPAIFSVLLFLIFIPTLNFFDVLAVIINLLILQMIVVFLLIIAPNKVLLTQAVLLLILIILLINQINL